MFPDRISKFPEESLWFARPEDAEMNGRSDEAAYCQQLLPFAPY